MNVVKLPINNLNDIPAMARKFADDVEKSEYGVVNAVVLAMDTDNGFHSFGWGDADDGYKVTGILQVAAHIHMSEIIGE